MNEFLSRLQDDLREVMDTVMCSRCRGKCRRLEMTMNLREPDIVLSVVGCIHATEEGDLGRFKHVVPHDQLHYSDEWKDL